ncbi:ABC transporter ATP-binding protein [Nakamurella endophytica]|uniref:ABC transporter ATP-binding protein n=1 Tax=Nakamurella endophytica TaxID=1748367 RepID=UPI001664A342
MPVRPLGAAGVQIDGVSKVFRGPGGSTVHALDSIDLTVAPGEFVCLLGASGCGKSTLLNLVAGLDRPTSGTVRVSGRPALMFQEAALFPWLTAGGNISLALKRAGVARRDRPARVAELLALVRLSGTADRRVHELSGGQRQRVALARALAQGGQVLLMDEPFAALDAITRDVLHDELTRVWKDTGRSVVFVTHNVREAVRLGQRVVLLSSRPGRVVGEWPVRIQGPRTIEHTEVSALAAQITVRLREEIASHAEA